MKISKEVGERLEKVSPWEWGERAKLTPGTMYLLSTSDHSLSPVKFTYYLERVTVLSQEGTDGRVRLRDSSGEESEESSYCCFVPVI